MTSANVTASSRPASRVGSHVATAVAAAALAVGGLAACTGSSPAATTASSTTTTTASSPTSASETPTTPSASSTARTINISLAGKTITPTPTTVDLKPGEKLTLVVTSDHDDKVHAHGFDVEKELKAGVPTTLELTGDQPGVYEIESHEPALTLMKVAVS